MYIFRYFFQKGHFQGSSKKRAHWQKLFLGGGGGAATPLSPPAPEGLCSLPPLLFSLKHNAWHVFAHEDKYFAHINGIRKTPTWKIPTHVFKYSNQCFSSFFYFYLFYFFSCLLMSPLTLLLGKFDNGHYYNLRVGCECFYLCSFFMRNVMLFIPFNLF